MATQGTVADKIVSEAYTGRNTVAAAAIKSVSPVQGMRVMLFGDSIADQNFLNTSTGLYDSPLRKYNRGLFNNINRLCGNIFPVVINKGVSGNDATQMAARFEVDVVSNANDFDILWVVWGPNSIRHSLDPLTEFNKLITMIERAAALGKTIVWQLPLPVEWSNTAAQASWTNTVTVARPQYQYIRNLCHNYLRSMNKDIRMLDLDLWQYFVDVTNANDGMLAKYSKLDGTLGSGDQIHPGLNGGIVVGNIIKDKVLNFFGVTKRPTYGPGNAFHATNNPYGNILGNPGMFTGTTSPAATVTGTVPASFTADRQAGTFEAADVVFSVDTFTQGSGHGKMTTITPTIPSGLSGTESISLRATKVTLAGKYAVGDSVVAGCRIKLNNVAALRSFACRMTHLTAASAVIAEVWDGDAGAAGDYIIDDGIYDLYMETYPYTLTELGDALQWWSLFYFDTRVTEAAGTIQVSEPYIRKI
jgi:hypothetical protein